ncbi:quinone oxidoreductase [Pikeienuella sp. HZG-20]|uniref:quinone oxidoreductase family protein n=1 Tax=Paludibacillus litoralis TaxID=3133267 RepID=UPI0030ED9A0B
MIKRISIEEFGGPEVMKLVTVDTPRPGTGEIAVQHEAIGLNFIDTYHRSGLYAMPLPSGIGLEAAGTVAEVGDGVTHLSVGDRVGYFSGPIGAYSEVHVVKAERAIKLPENISSATAAASMLKGLTVQYLIRRIYDVKAGETVLFHAIAGGVGLIACQWLKHLGATVIGTVGSEEKAALAAKAGCDHIVRYDKDDVSAAVREITNGDKVPVVFDGVGKSTWESSLDSLRKRGLMVSFGNASGPVTGVNLGILASKGSLFVTRPTLFDYTETREDLDAAAKDLFDVIASGAVTVDINAEYPLDAAVTAHRDLEARKTTGSTILRP